MMLRTFTVTGVSFYPSKGRKDALCIRCREALPKGTPRFHLHGSWKGEQMCPGCAADVQATYLKHQQHIEGEPHGN